VHLLRYVAKCTVTDWPLKTQTSCSSALICLDTFSLSCEPDNVSPYEALQRC